MNQEDFNEAVLGVTGGADWDVVKKGLASEIYACQARALDAESWAEVCELRGFAKGLAFIMNLREVTQEAKKHGYSAEAENVRAIL